MVSILFFETLIVWSIAWLLDVQNQCISKTNIDTAVLHRNIILPPTKERLEVNRSTIKNTVMKNDENIWTPNSCHPNLVSPFCVRCKAPMLWTTWVPVISLRGLRSFFGAEGCITFFLGCPAGQDRTLLSQCRIELLAVCKTKIVRDRKLTKTSKSNRPESGRAYWNENLSVWKSRTLSSSLCLRASKFW